MLQVGINDNAGLAARVIKACSNGNLLAEIAAKRQAAIAGIVLMQGGDLGRGFIRRAIIDDDNFEFFSDFNEARGQPV